MPDTWEIGDNVRLGPYVRIGAAQGSLISIGNNVSINQGTYIVAVKKILIGNDVRIGEYASVRDNDHEWRDSAQPIRTQGYRADTTIIGNDVWIGRGAVIGKGIRIGDGAVIGANAVVTKNVPEMAVFAGVPAKKIGGAWALKLYQLLYISSGLLLGQGSMFVAQSLIIANGDYEVVASIGIGLGLLSLVQWLGDGGGVFFSFKAKSKQRNISGGIFPIWARKVFLLLHCHHVCSSSPGRGSVG